MSFVKYLEMKLSLQNSTTSKNCQTLTKLRRFKDFYCRFFLEKPSLC